ncbi:MAG: exodeoxyribonuclease VII small subunit [bacterium]|nr:exodeoxyribonuclease VII small subunit [bacterium]
MPKKKHQFEAALQQLEEIVAQMESSDLPLDECVEYYERAVKLAALCTKELEAARRRIEQVRFTEKGETVIEPLTLSDDSSSPPATTDNDRNL